MHLWPPARPDRRGPETSYLAAGAALDIVGLRSWDLDPATVGQVLARWPRAGFVDDLVRRWRAECAAVPGGRADFLRRYGGFLLAARLAPFPHPHPPI